MEEEQLLMLVRGLGLYKGIFEYCPEGLFVIDAAGTIRAWNPAMEKMTGWRREEVVGKESCLVLFRCRFEGGDAVDHESCPGRFALSHFSEAKDVELILLSKEGREMIVSTSYGALPADPAESPFHPGYAVAVVREITGKKRVEKEREIEAVTDELTGLYNYRYFRRFLDLELKRSVRYQHSLSLIMIDIDHFKCYNDLHGHPAGNAVLKRLAALLRENTRATNVVARYGGEEFCIILPETEKEVALEAARRLHQIVQKEVFPHEEEQPGGDLTVSMGVASCPADAKEEEILILAADQRLYRAKRLGRNRVEGDGDGE